MPFRHKRNYYREAIDRFCPCKPAGAKPCAKPEVSGWLIKKTNLQLKHKLLFQDLCAPLGALMLFGKPKPEFLIEMAGGMKSVEGP